MKRRAQPHAEPRPHIACAHAQCPQPAILSINLKHAKDVNLCKQHYEFHISEEAREFCKLNNLTTRKAQREYIAKFLKRFGRGFDPIDHWKKVSATPNLTSMSYILAKEALERLHATRDPGEEG